MFSTPTVSFDLDIEQVKKANIWAVRHRCTQKGQYGTAGDKYHLTFVPTGIGTFVTAYCSCGKEIDLTGDL